MATTNLPNDVLKLIFCYLHKSNIIDVLNELDEIDIDYDSHEEYNSYYVVHNCNGKWNHIYKYNNIENCDLCSSHEAWDGMGICTKNHDLCEDCGKDLFK